MKRRAFIVGLAAAPWFIRRAFGDASIGGGSGATVGPGARAPSTSTRPTLVLVVPRDDGARWGHTTMCGNEYEEGPAEMVDCGMGHVPEASRRFLDFYTGKKS